MSEEIEDKQEQVAEETHQQEVIEQPNEAPKQDASHNWELARQALAQQKAEIEQLKYMLGNKAPEPEPDEFDGLDPSDYLTVEEAKKRFEKTIEKKSKQAIQAAMEEFKVQQKVLMSEEKLRSKYEDYDFVVENYAIPIIKNDPALAMQVQRSKNPAETAYKLGKMSDAYEENMTKQQSTQKSEKILKNSQRPVSAAAISAPLKSQADNFSKRSKEDIWAESQKYAKGA